MRLDVRVLDPARSRSSMKLHPLAATAALFLVTACSSSDDASAPPPAAASAPTDPAAGAGEDTGPAASAPRALPANGSAGCGTSKVAAGAGQRVDVDVNGDARSYLLSVPAKYDAYRAYPVVFVFHSGGGTGERARSYFDFESFAGDEAIFVYPDGNHGEWNLDAPTKDNEDVAFFDAMLAKLKTSACIDPSKVFSTGSSMGAYFSNQLGCRRGDDLRAIAPHAGGGPFDEDAAYDETGHLRCEGKPVAAMVFHGDSDTNVDVSDGQLSVDHWVWANGCRKSSRPIAPSPCVTYDGCKNPVTWCKIPGLGHRVWSEGPKATWAFFSSF